MNLLIKQFQTLSEVNAIKLNGHSQPYLLSPFILSVVVFHTTFQLIKIKREIWSCFSFLYTCPRTSK